MNGFRRSPRHAFLGLPAIDHHVTNRLFPQVVRGFDPRLRQEGEVMLGLLSAKPVDILSCCSQPALARCGLAMLQ